MLEQTIVEKYGQNTSQVRLENVMRIYKDKDLKEEAENLDLGTLIAGESKNFIFYVYNELNVDVEDLEFSTGNEEVYITSAPKKLDKQTASELHLTWTPSVTVKKALKTELRVKGYEIYRN